MHYHSRYAKSLLTAGAVGATALGVGLVNHQVPTVHAAVTDPHSTVTPEQQAQLDQIKADHQAADDQARDQYQQGLNQAKQDQNQADLTAQQAHDQAVGNAQEQYQQGVQAATDAAQKQADGQQSQAYQQAQQDAQTAYQQQVDQIKGQYQAGAQQASQVQTTANQTAQTQLTKDQQAATKAPLAPAQGLNDLSQLSDSGKQVLTENSIVDPMTSLGQYGSVPDYWIADGPAKVAATVSSEGQLPTNFVPGVILYDETNDHSDVIAATGLTEAQKERLNDLSTTWMNSLRDYYYHTLKGQPLSTIPGMTNADGSINYATLKTEADFWQVAQDIGQMRENENWTYNHTLTKFGSHNYYDIINGVMPQGQAAWSAENLYVLTGHTMLEFEVGLYNRMQGMLYEELNQNPDGSYFDSVGHLKNALNPVFSEVAMGFQKLSNNSTSAPAYNVVWEFYGTSPDNSLDQKLNQYFGNHQQTLTTPVGTHQSTGGFVQTSVLNDIHIAQTTPQTNQPALRQAQTKYQTALDQATQTYQDALTKLAQTRDAALAQAQAAYEQKMADFKEQYGQPAQATVDPTVLAKLAAQRDQAIKDADTALSQAQAAAQTAYDTQAAQLKATYQQALDANATKAQAAEAELRQQIADANNQITLGGDDHNGQPTSDGNDSAVPSDPASGSDQNIAPVPSEPTNGSDQSAAPAPSDPASDSDQNVAPVPSDPTSDQATQPTAPTSDSDQNVAPVPSNPASGSDQDVAPVPSEPDSGQATQPTTPTSDSDQNVAPVPSEPTNGSDQSAAPAPSDPTSGSDQDVAPVPSEPTNGSDQSAAPAPSDPTSGSDQSTAPAPSDPASDQVTQPTAPTNSSDQSAVPAPSEPDSGQATQPTAPTNGSDQSAAPAPSKTAGEVTPSAAPAPEQAVKTAQPAGKGHATIVGAGAPTATVTPQVTIQLPTQHHQPTAQLPQTGDNVDATAVVAGTSVLTLMLGLLGLRRKHRVE